MVHKVEKKEFTASFIGFIKGDPLLKPFLSEEKTEEEKSKPKEKLVDTLASDL